VAKTRAALIRQAFGDLRWDPEHQWWATEYCRPSGEVVRVAVLNDALGPRRRRVERAADLFLRTVDAEPRTLREALAGEVPGRLNTLSREAGGPELSGEEWAARVRLAFVAVYWCVPVTLSYDVGQPAEGRTVWLDLDEEFRLLRARVM
jgi:hypothetical protein